MFSAGVGSGRHRMHKTLFIADIFLKYCPLTIQTNVECERINLARISISICLKYY